MNAWVCETFHLACQVSPALHKFKPELTGQCCRLEIFLALLEAGKMRVFILCIVNICVGSWEIGVDAECDI